MEKKYNTSLSHEIKKGKPTIMIHFEKGKNKNNMINNRIIK